MGKKLINSCHYKIIKVLLYETGLHLNARKLFGKLNKRVIYPQSFERNK